MAKSIDLYIDQGADFVAILPPVTNAVGVVVDLTGYTAVSMIRRSYATLNAVQLVVTIGTPITGVVTLSLPSAQTRGLAPFRYVYDVNVTDSEGVVTKVFEGLVTVNAGVSNKPNTSLVVPYIPDDFGGPC